MDYLALVTKDLFEKPLGDEGRRMLLFYYAEYLKGAKGVHMDDGTQIEFNFDKLKDEDKFPVPSLYFMLFETDPSITIHEIIVLVYLSYLAFKNKSHVVKFDKDLAVKRTSFSKTKLKETLQNLIDHELELVKLGEKNNMFEIPHLEPKLVDDFNHLTKEFAATIEKVESGDIPHSETTSIPTYFMGNAQKMGFSHYEQHLITMLAMYQNQDFKIAMNSLKEKFEGLTDFEIKRVIVKAENKKVIRLIKQKEKYSIDWLPLAFGE